MPGMWNDTDPSAQMNVFQIKTLSGGLENVLCRTGGGGDNGGVRGRWAILWVLLLISRLSAAESAADRHFLDKVKPLLDSRCVDCHGPDKQKGGLRLDSRAAAILGGDSGPAIVPGRPADSLILQAVLHARAKLE